MTSLPSNMLRRSCGDLNTTGGTKYSLDITIDGELTSGQSTNHEETSTDTGIAATETKLLGDLDQAGGSALTGETLGLVDLGKHGVCRLRYNGGGKASDETRSQVDNSLCSISGSLLVDKALVDTFDDLLVDHELGHGVRNLLEQDGAETTVESANTFSLEDLAETADETGSKGRFGDETNASGFERAESNIGEEFGGGSRGKVDGSSVVFGGLVAEQVDRLLLEEFVSSKFQSSLQEVTRKGRASTGQESACAFILDDFPEATDQASVVCDGIKLNSCLDDIDGSETTVGQRAADGASEGESAVEVDAGELLGGVGCRRLDDSVELC